MRFRKSRISEHTSSRCVSRSQRPPFSMCSSASGRSRRWASAARAGMKRSFGPNTISVGGRSSLFSSDRPTARTPCRRKVSTTYASFQTSTDPAEEFIELRDGRANAAMQALASRRWSHRSGKRSRRSPFELGRRHHSSSVGRGSPIWETESWIWRSSIRRCTRCGR